MSWHMRNFTPSYGTSLNSWNGPMKDGLGLPDLWGMGECVDWEAVERGDAAFLNDCTVADSGDWLDNSAIICWHFKLLTIDSTSRPSTQSNNRSWIWPPQSSHLYFKVVLFCHTRTLLIMKTCLYRGANLPSQGSKTISPWSCRYPNRISLILQQTSLPRCSIPLFMQSKKLQVYYHSTARQL